MPRAKATVSPMIGKIVGSAEDIHQKIVAGRKPSMKFPLRSLSNVRYTPRKGYFEMTGKKKERTLTVATVTTFAQTLRMISLSKKLIETDDFATKRDAYYQDIVDYKLPTHPLKDVDVKRAKDALKNDPFFQHHREWAKAFEHLLKMGVRAEQQAFAKHDLNFVLDKYLPEKLKHPEKFLP